MLESWAASMVLKSHLTLVFMWHITFNLPATKITKYLLRLVAWNQPLKSTARLLTVVWGGNPVWFGRVFGVELTILSWMENRSTEVCTPPLLDKYPGFLLLFFWSVLGLELAFVTKKFWFFFISLIIAGTGKKVNLLYIKPSETRVILGIWCLLPPTDTLQILKK